MHILTGILLVITSTFMFTVGQVFIKFLSSEIPITHIIFWRCLSGLIILFFLALGKKRLLPAFWELSRRSGLWLVFRGIVGTAVMFSFFIAISLADLGDVGALVNISPVFAVTFAWVFLGEKLHNLMWISLGLAVSGVLLISNPFGGMFSLAYILLILAASGHGFTLTTIKKLNDFGVDRWLIVAPFMSLGALISLPFLFIHPRDYSLKILLFLLAMGVTTTTGQLLLTASAKYLRVQTISILNLMTIFELMFLGYLFFHEEINPAKLFGGIIIFTASVLAIYGSYRRSASLKNQP